VTRRIHVASLVLIGLLSACQAFVWRHFSNPDGLSYLDIARAVAEGDWAQVHNPHWGPLYPALMGLALRAARLSPSQVLPLVHLVNLLVSLLAAGAFTFLLLQLSAERPPSPGAKVLSPAAMLVFAYAVFAQLAIHMIGQALVTPDMLLMGTVFMAAGLSVRLRRAPTVRDAVLLGVTLGAGYLSKSVMFVLVPVFLLSCWRLMRTTRRGRWKLMYTAASFLVIAAVHIVPISRETGYFTSGTAGRLAYLWSVGGLPYANWDGSTAGLGTPEHPPMHVFRDPDVFAYSAHLKGTYPPWSDPAYWNAGARLRVRIGAQLLQLHRSLDSLLYLVLGWPGATITLLVSMLWFCTDQRLQPGALRMYSDMLLTALVACVLYALVHIEPRYLAPFLGLLWIVPAAALRWRSVAERRQWPDRAALIVAGILTLPLAFRMVGDAWKARGEQDPYAAVASALNRAGVHRGDRVANIGLVAGQVTGSSFEAYWAFLARVQIVAEMPAGQEFLCAPPGPASDDVYRAMARLGAKAVVARAIPGQGCARGWDRVPATDFYIRRLRPDSLTPTPASHA
jgi:hypothetical protein